MWGLNDQKDRGYRISNVGNISWLSSMPSPKPSPLVLQHQEKYQLFCWEVLHTHMHPGCSLGCWDDSFVGHSNYQGSSLKPVPVPVGIILRSCFNVWLGAWKQCIFRGHLKGGKHVGQFTLQVGGSKPGKLPGGGRQVVAGTQRLLSSLVLCPPGHKPLSLLLLVSGGQVWWRK